MISFKIKASGQFRTEKFSWYCEDSAPRPRQIIEATEANDLLSKVVSSQFALRVITANTNKYDLDSKIMTEGGNISFSFDAKDSALIADVEAEYNLIVNDKTEEKEIKELYKSSNLSFHVMELRIVREGVKQFFGPEGGTVVGGSWENKTVWPSIEILECSLFKKK